MWFVQDVRHDDVLVVFLLDSGWEGDTSSSLVQSTLIQSLRYYAMPSSNDKPLTQACLCHASLKNQGRKKKTMCSWKLVTLDYRYFNAVVFICIIKASFIQSMSQHGTESCAYSVLALGSRYCKANIRRLDGEPRRPQALRGEDAGDRVV